MLAGLPLSAAELPTFTYRRGATLAEPLADRWPTACAGAARTARSGAAAARLRRSELVGLDVADVRFVHDGMVLTLRRSKTDQEGDRRAKGNSVRRAARELPGARAPGLARGRRQRAAVPAGDVLGARG